MRYVLTALATLLIMASFVAFPQQSGDAVAKFMAVTQSAAAAVIQHQLKPGAAPR
jgi:hypothetical protein